MLRKSFTLRTPVDQYAVALEMFLTDVSKNALRGLSGSYVGDGLASHKIMTPFSPTFIMIQKSVDFAKTTSPSAGNIAVAIMKNAGVTWVSETGFVNNAVLSVQNDGFTIGNHADVNTGGTTYTYFIVG